jgi:tetratricopeptide (TPR) repeat protein
MNPRFAQAHFRRGLALYRLDKKEQGLADVEKSLRMDPLMTDAQIFFAVHTGDKDKAIAAATAACEVKRYENDICVQLLAWVCARGGDFDNAVRWQKKALEMKVIGRDQAEERLKSYRQGKFPASNPPYWHFEFSE